MTNKYKMVIAGGGTGGHFFPAIAILNQLQKMGIQVKYIGSKYGLESNNSILEKDKILLLNINGIQRHFNLDSIYKNLLFPFRFIFSYLKSRIFIKKFQPDVVIGTGGYSSGIPLYASIHLGIKTVIQEQNSYPGITTRYLSNKVDRVCIAYNDMKKIFSYNRNIIFTGNPIRDDIQKMDKKQAKTHFNLNINKPVLTVLGGSQGSVPLNNYFINNIIKYIDNDIQLIWQCGKKSFKNLSNNTNLKHKNIHLIPFYDNMSALYSASDLIISRSGALTLSEMAYMGKAMILIPFPNSAGNHQHKNATIFQNKGAALLVKQSEMKSKKLETKIFKLFKDPNKLKKMENKAEELATPNAINDIIKTIMEIATK